MDWFDVGNYCCDSFFAFVQSKQCNSCYNSFYIMATIIILYATGQTLNIMTLGAIAAAIGLIIDDAIVVVEQIHRTHEEHPDEPSSVLVQKAIHYLFPAMVGSSLSTIVIFLPF